MPRFPIANVSVTKRSLTLPRCLFFAYFAAFSFICLVFSGRAAHADLNISGASTIQHQVLEDVFANHISPRFHSMAKIDVQVLTRTAMLDYIRQGEPSNEQADQDSDDTIDGIYQDGPPTVSLRSTKNTDDLSFTFAHEYGHFVWQDLLTAAERKSYAMIYNKQRAAHHLVTAYAATELDEGFAEAFSFYTMEPPMLERRDPLSYRFLCDVHINH